MYGKIFESMYEGSLYGQWEAIVTMQQLIVLANEDGVVDMTPPAIAGKTSIPLDIIEKGLEILSKPDPYSRTKDNDGIRIELIDDHRPWGWSLVNYAKYRDLVRREDKLRADRERIAKRRNSNKNNDVAFCRNSSQLVANVAHTDTDTDNKNTCSFEPFWNIYPRKEGKAKAEKAFKALNKKDQQALIDHLPKRLKHESFDQPKKYIPLPATFINGRRWEDELTAEAKSSLSNIRDLQL